MCELLLERYTQDGVAKALEQYVSKNYECVRVCALCRRIFIAAKSVITKNEPLAAGSENMSRASRAACLLVIASIAGKLSALCHCCQPRCNSQ